MTKWRYGIPALLLAMAACKPAPVDETAASNAPANATADAVVNDMTAQENGAAGNLAGAEATAGWSGRWLGPEGLFLDIAPAKDKAPVAFDLRLKDTLDREESYIATLKDGALMFTRDGKVEQIRPGAGPETGFKYLADKQDCLIIQPGKEGYCR